MGFVVVVLYVYCFSVSCCVQSDSRLANRDWWGKVSSIVGIGKPENQITKVNKTIHLPTIVSFEKERKALNEAHFSVVHFLNKNVLNTLQVSAGNCLHQNASSDLSGSWLSFKTSFSAYELCGFSSLKAKKDWKYIAEDGTSTTIEVPFVVNRLDAKIPFVNVSSRLITLLKNQPIAAHMVEINLVGQIYAKKSKKNNNFVVTELKSRVTSTGGLKVDLPYEKRSYGLSFGGYHKMLEDYLKPIFIDILSKYLQNLVGKDFFLDSLEWTEKHISLLNKTEKVFVDTINNEVLHPVLAQFGNCVHQGATNYSSGSWVSVSTSISAYNACGFANLKAEYGLTFLGEDKYSTTVEVSFVLKDVNAKIPSLNVTHGYIPWITNYPIHVHIDKTSILGQIRVSKGHSAILSGIELTVIDYEGFDLKIDLPAEQRSYKMAMVECRQYVESSVKNMVTSTVKKIESLIPVVREKKIPSA